MWHLENIKAVLPSVWVVDLSEEPWFGQLKCVPLRDSNFHLEHYQSKEFPEVLAWMPKEHQSLSQPERRIK